MEGLGRTMLDENSYIGQLRKVLGHRTLLIPGAAVVIENKQQQVLLHQRGDNHLWCVPGGSAEEGLDFIATAVKELNEETGLTVAPQDLTAFASLSDPLVNTLRYPNGDVSHYFVLCFWATRWQGELKSDGVETLNLDFFAPHQIPKNSLPSTTKILQFLAEFKQSRVFQVG